MKYTRKIQNSIFLHGAGLTYSQAVTDLLCSIPGCTLDRILFFQELLFSGSLRLNWIQRPKAHKLHNQFVSLEEAQDTIKARFTQEENTGCVSQEILLQYILFQSPGLILYAKWQLIYSKEWKVEMIQQRELFITKLLSLGRDIKRVRSAL